MNLITHRDYLNELDRITYSTKIKITTHLGLLAMLLLALTLSGCGGVQTTLVTRPDSLIVLKEVNVMPPEVSSDEEPPETMAQTEQLKRLAAYELRLLMKTKKIALSSESKEAVQCNIDVKYGSRALRYWVGFGAGKGYIRVKVQLKDGDGTIRYSGESEADLAMGAFGGNMSDVARDAIRTAVEEFGTHLRGG